MKRRKDEEPASSNDPSTSATDDWKEKERRETTAETNKKKKREIRKRLIDEARGEARSLSIGTAAMIVSSLSNQAVPRMLGALLDQNTIGAAASCASSSSLPGTCPADSTTGFLGSLLSLTSSPSSSLALVMLGGGVASFLRTTTLKRAEDGIAKRLRSRAFRSLLCDRDAEWFQSGTTAKASSSPSENVADSAAKISATDDDRSDADVGPGNGGGLSPGAALSILNDDVSLVSKILTVTLANLIRSACSCGFGALRMIRIDPKLFLSSFAVAPVVGIAAVALRKRVRLVAEKQRESAEKAAAFAEERLRHVDCVKMHRRESDESQRYEALQVEIAELGRAASLADGAFMGFLFAAASGALFATFDAGGKAVSNGTMSPGDLTSFATHTFLMGLGAAGVARSSAEMARGMVSAERVYRLIDGDDDGEGGEGGTGTGSGGSRTGNEVSKESPSVDSIALVNVSFSYRSDSTKRVLHEISLTLRRGTIVALVGKNGSGKSTVAKLLAGLHEPTSGQIVVVDSSNDGIEREVEYGSLDRRSRTSLVSVVPQSPALFDDTILSNASYGDPTASTDRIRSALSAANCDGFLSDLDDGIGHVVGRDGSKLSGGQRQRLGLARALLTDPAVLVLDEPTSAMDAEGEGAVADAVNACRKKDGTTGGGRGLLLITHRAKTLELVDEVVVLREGRIVERGPYHVLRNDRGSELCKLMPDLL